MHTSLTGLSVSGYTDYRAFLCDYYDHRKQAGTGWSLRSWTRQLGLKSHTTLAMILKGRRNPRLSLAKRMSQTMGLDPREESYFLDLIRLERVREDPNASISLMEGLAKQRRSGSYRHLDHGTFKVISDWYHFAIRDMVSMAQFREDPEWISQHLSFPVTPKEVSESLSRLKRLGLLKRVRGRLHVVDLHVETDADIANEAIKRFHEQTLDNAKTAVRIFLPDEREIIGTTFAFRKRDLQKAKELIRKFHRDFCSMLENKGTDSVYQLEVAFYPIAEGDIS